MFTLPAKRFIASFDVDAQRTFTPICPTELPVQGGDEIAPELNAQAAFAALRLGSKDAHSLAAQWLANEANPALSAMQAENMDRRWPPHAIVGTEGFELLQDLPHPTRYDFFVWKGVEPDMHPYGACFHDLQDRFSTGVIEFLRMREIKLVLVGGLALDYCVAKTAMQLRQAGLEVVVNLAACRGIASDSCESAKATLRAAGAHFIDSHRQLQPSG